MSLSKNDAGRPGTRKSATCPQESGRGCSLAPKFPSLSLSSQQDSDARHLMNSAQQRTSWTVHSVYLCVKALYARL